VTKAAPDASDAAKACFDWIDNVPSAAPEPVADDASEPFPSSTYSHDFLSFKSVRMPAPFKPATESQVEGCLDWDTVAAAVPAAAPAVTTSVNAEDWVVVDTAPAAPAAAKRSNAAVVPGWGSVPSAEQYCSTYDWDFDGAWKKYTPSANASKARQKKQAFDALKQAKEDGIKAQAAKAKARAAKIKKLAETKGVAKQSAAELYVAEKMLPFFATGSEYQKRYSVPAAVRQKAVARIVKTQEKVAAGFRKPSGSSMKNNPILSGGRRFPTSVQNIPVRTSYQSAFGSGRATSLKARIRRLAAQEA
jgi:hypothetical protein